MPRYLLFAAFGWLAFSGTMHFVIDVVSHAIQGRHPPGRETQLYYGMNSAFALGQVAFGLLALLTVWRAPQLAGTAPLLLLSVAVGIGWLVVAFLFIEYREPRVASGIYGALIIAAVGSWWLQAPLGSGSAAG